MNDHKDSYTKVINLAGTFENKVLYRMCFENPNHNSAYINSGKVLAIGRIYAASPERGAGQQKNNAKYEPLSIAIGRKLAQSDLDKRLNRINYNQQFSDDHTLDFIVKIHGYLNEILKEAIVDWGGKTNKEVRNQISFTSKYLHFHRPNAFPIIDSFVKQGLRSVDYKGAYSEYKGFCKNFLNYRQKKCKNDWTLRCIDTHLVEKGRAHMKAKIKKVAQAARA